MSHVFAMQVAPDHWVTYYYNGAAHVVIVAHFKTEAEARAGAKAENARLFPKD